MVIFAVASLALWFLAVLSFLTLDVVTFCHQIGHLKNHGPIIRLLALTPTAFTLSCQRLRVLVVIKLGVIHRMVVVGVVLRDWLQLRAVVGVDVGALVRVGS